MVLQKYIRYSVTQLSSYEFSCSSESSCCIYDFMATMGKKFILGEDILHSEKLLNLHFFWRLKGIGRIPPVKAHLTFKTRTNMGIPILLGVSRHSWTVMERDVGRMFSLSSSKLDGAQVLALRVVSLSLSLVSNPSTSRAVTLMKSEQRLLFTDWWSDAISWKSGM